MVPKILAYTILNIKSLLKDKISFIWAILLPMIMFLLNFQNIESEKDFIPWWVYMVLCAFIYGIGVYTLELKEAGCLRTIFSIHYSPTAFFLGNLTTQIIFSVLSILVFDIVAGILKQFSISHLMVYSFGTIVLCIPFAFWGHGVTLLKRLHVNSIRTISTILIFGMFLLVGRDTMLNRYNPLYRVLDLVINYTIEKLAGYCIFTILSFILGGISIWRFEPNSNERR